MNNIMMNLKRLMIPFLLFLFTISCQQEMQKDTTSTIDPSELFEQEKAAILAVINDETKAAFNRDYEGWQEKWVHEAYVSKTYMDFSNNSMTETLGWEEINHFVKTYIEEHPEPDPLPKLVNSINVWLYGLGAWVEYEQNDAERGLKRETRLMEKVDGQWKIAGMHTTIYGLEKEKN